MVGMERFVLVLMVICCVGFCLGGSECINMSEGYVCQEIIHSSLSLDYKNNIIFDIDDESKIVFDNNPLEGFNSVESLDSEMTDISSVEWVAHEVINPSDKLTNSIHVVDLESDGYMDVLSGNSDWIYSGPIISRNRGNFEFGTTLIDTVSDIIANSIYSADIDSDGNVDIISASTHNDMVIWYRNLGNGYFRTYNVVTFYPDGPSSIFSADIDSDGDMDVITGSINDDSVMWIENDGNGNFPLVHIITTFVDGCSSVYSADIDSDGDMDIISSSFHDDMIVWYENNGTGNFLEGHLITTHADGASDVFVADVDSDGDMDIVSASSNDNMIAWYENDGTGNFEFGYIVTTSANGVSSVYVNDIDSDGDMDIVSANFNYGVVAWYENDGDEYFSMHIVSGWAYGASDVFVADMDLDGDMDIVSANIVNDEVICYENVFSEEEFCSGSLNVFIEDSFGNSMEGLRVYSEEDYKNSDIDGSAFFDLNVSCGEIVDVEVQCSDGVKVCDSGSIIIGSDGDVDSMSFVCDVCRDGFDIWVNEDELVFEEVGSGLMISSEVHSLGLSKDVDVSLIKSCGGVKSFFEKKSVVVLEGESQVVSFTGDFENCEKIDIIVEHFEEEDVSTNNVILDFFIIDPLNVYLEVDSGYSDVDLVIEEFVGEYVQVVSTKSEADLKVYIGKRLYDSDYLDDRLIRFEGVKEGLPYNGLIVKRDRELYIFGNEIDGTVAAVRRLVDERETYLNERTLWFDMGDVYLGGRDMEAVSVYDYLHSDENVEVYRKNGKAFANVVDSVLNRKTFVLDVKRVLTANDGTSLRMKNIKSEMSEGFREFVGERPVVMAGGLFNDLGMWEGEDKDGLAFELANKGRDVWEIEITGGPNTECKDCPDYTYLDLVDYYWPALIAGVQYYTGAVSVDYVGFSNGCRVALSSLEKYQESGKANAGVVDEVDVDLEGSISARVVDSFVGVGCPGAFEGDSFLIEQVGKHPGSVEGLRGEGHTHPGFDDIASKNHLFALKILLPSKNPISLNLWGYYVDAILSKDDSQPGNFNVNKLRLVYGFGGVNGMGNEQDDGMVTKQDSIAVASSINSGNVGQLQGYEISHPFLPNENIVISDIRRFLENGN
ncbi:MAG: VCBS repeat-containing protein [archaeon]